MTKAPDKIRYAVVGLGYIAQSAILPAFGNASRNSGLVALVSDDPEKRRVRGKKYGVEHLRARRPGLGQAIQRPVNGKREFVHAEEPSPAD